MQPLENLGDFPKRASWVPKLARAFHVILLLGGTGLDGGR